MAKYLNFYEKRYLSFKLTSLLSEWFDYAKDGILLYKLSDSCALK